MRSTFKTTLVGMAAVGILGGTGIAMPLMASADQARPQHQTSARAADDNGRHHGRHHEPGDDNGRHHEAGDNRGQRGSHLEPGDDNGGHGGHHEPGDDHGRHGGGHR
jgi:hypothetical protein